MRIRIRFAVETGRPPITHRLRPDPRYTCAPLRLNGSAGGSPRSARTTFCSSSTSRDVACDHRRAGIGGVVCPGEVGHPGRVRSHERADVSPNRCAPVRAEQGRVGLLDRGQERLRDRVPLPPCERVSAGGLRGEPGGGFVHRLDDRQVAIGLLLGRRL
jgi:hypothetical protein